MPQCFQHRNCASDPSQRQIVHGRLDALIARERPQVVRSVPPARYRLHAVLGALCLQPARILGVQYEAFTIALNNKHGMKRSQW